MRVAFLYVAICRRYNEGIGRISTIKSVTRLITPVTVKLVT
jgi:hypothetical protein